MTAFEYLFVLISIILALGMTRVLAGVDEMLQARSHRQIYWVHAIWIINLFLYLVIAWWIFYDGATSSRGHFSCSSLSLSPKLSCIWHRFYSLHVISFLIFQTLA